MLTTQAIRSSWIQECITTPYREGVERLERAWKGIDFHSICHNRLSLKQRAVSLATGIALLTPLVNAIVWMFWRIFGHPEQLSLLYQHQEPLPALFRPLSLASQSGQQADRTEQLIYNEGKVAGMVKWQIRHFKKGIEVKKQSALEQVEAIYTSNWELQTYKNTVLKFPDTYMEGTRTAGKLTIQGKNEGILFRKEFILEKDLPWVQQTTLGLRKFALSKDTEFHFYSFNPKTYGLLESAAKKTGMDNGLLKVAVHATGLLKHAGSAQIWFCPKTSVVQKMAFSGLAAFFTSSVTLVQSDLSQQSAQPKSPAR